jgi:23S rRNA (guanosine2251-2'-O)-methyltransferase
LEKNNNQTDLIFGIRPLIEAIEAGKEIDNVFIQEGLRGDLLGELKRVMQKRGIIYKQVPIEKINRITHKNHQGVIGFVSPVTFHRLEDIVTSVFEEGKSPLLLILDRITDVRNFGAIARSAACAGVDAVIIPSRGSSPINSDAVKTSAGALYSIPVCKEHNLKSTIEYLKECGLQIVAVTEKATDHYHQADFSGPTALLMGSEEDGISPEYLKLADARVKIPIIGKIASLNVSVATGIVLFEAVKQRPPQ